MRLLTVLALVMSVQGCGGAPTTPSGTPGEGASATSPDALRADPGAPLSTGPMPARARLQGTWEITRYTSDRPIPDDAMPLMGTLFESLRLRFQAGRFIAGTKPSTEESTEFAIAGEKGDEFTLIAKGGLFDGARCRFVDADTWEANDRGPSWPGVSVLRRVSGAGGKAGSPAPGRGSADRRGR